MSMQSKSSIKGIVKTVMRFALPIALTLFYAGYASAGDIGSVASTLRGTFEAIAKLVTAMAYVVGMGFGVSAMLKFKAHKDNPQATPLGTPMMLLFVAAGLIFLPSVFGLAGGSLGVTAAGGVSGTAGIAT